MAPNLQLDILQNLISSAFSRLPAMIKQMKIAVKKICRKSNVSDLGD